eukprot:SAG11_NODE_34305_length_272_cov_1.734104_1_plen_49_part_01
MNAECFTRRGGARARLTQCHSLWIYGVAEVHRLGIASQIACTCQKCMTL